MKPILDVTCGSRMMWFDKENPLAVFMDNRRELCTLSDGRTLEINPDMIGDFKSIPFEDKSFSLVVFDPPHLVKAGQNSWLKHKYGLLQENWAADIEKGFHECFRVLDDYGVLVFKWSEDQVTVSRILDMDIPRPLFGHRRGKTIFLVFMATPEGRLKIAQRGSQ